MPEFAAAYYGILRAGAVAVPLDVDATRDELRSTLADAGAALLIAWRGLPPPRADLPTWLAGPGSFFDDGAPIADAGPAVERRPDDTAVILYTSGTTGRPKGVQLTHANLESNARVTAALFGFGPADAVLGALPLAHAFGQTCTLNAAILAGARVVLAPSFEPPAEATVLVGVPSMYASLLARTGAGRRARTRCGCASPAARRWPPSCSRRARRHSGPGCSRATGCPRPRPSPRSTARGTRAARARSAARSTASRCGCSRSRPRAWGRSPSAAPTS